MNIKEEDLEDFPVQFKEINYSDFPDYNYVDEKKVIITPDVNGYISDALWNKVDLTSKDTTIINAGVGQGKTKAIIEFIKYYCDKTEQGIENYKIIVITPFKSLNFEYETKISELTGSKNLCFDYQELSEIHGRDFEVNFEKPVQLISIKSILGDPGINALEQNSTKRNYYQYIIENCKVNNQKVIMFFDELHECLESFTKPLIPNLFKWKDIVHKIIVASATFSESAIGPLKYFGEITDNKIKIIESKRTLSPNKSDLSLYFYNRPDYDVKDYYLQYIFDKLINNGDFSAINIFCYSKKLAELIFNSSIGDKIRDKFKDFNLCIGGEDEITFDKEISNIGTTFKTGVSIEKENSCFVVLLPTNFSNLSRRMGVFTDRINSLTQTLARPRVKSEIVVVTPIPSELITRDDDSLNYIEKLSIGFLQFENKEKQSPFKFYSEQTEILKKKYKDRKNPITKEITFVEELSEDLKIYYDSFDWFRLENGDAFLYENFEAYGKTLANYLYWAAWNNQFVNCRLKSINFKFPMFFTEGKFQEGFDKYIPEELVNEGSFVDFSDKIMYEKVREFLFSNNIFINSVETVENIELPKRSKITPFKNSTFEQQIIHFLQRRKTPYLFEPEYGCMYSTSRGEVPIDDTRLNKEKYIRMAISQCKSISEQSENLDQLEHNLVSSYIDLYEFKDKLLNQYSFLNSKNEHLLPIDSNFKFENQHLIKLKIIFENLIRNEIGFKIFNLKQIPSDKSIYSILRKVFFKTATTTFQNLKYFKIVDEYSVEYSEYTLNLIFNTADPFLYTPINPAFYNTEANNDILHLEPLENGNLRITWNNLDHSSDSN